MNRLSVRLSLAFVVVAWVAIGAVALIVRGATETSFRRYVGQRMMGGFEESLADQLEEYYAVNGSWEDVETVLSEGRGRGRGMGMGRGPGPAGQQFVIANPEGMVVAASDAALVGQQLSAAQREQAVGLDVSGEMVGWLAGEIPIIDALGDSETRFLSEVTSGMLVAVAGAALLAVVVGAGLAWQLARPLRELTGAVHDLRTGQLGRQVPTSGPAEVTELADAFNAMSQGLAEGEVLRRRMAADVAHELRSPVSVVRGHLEAMLDDVFPLDKEQLAVAHDQTIHLSRLVDDLRLLTLAEAGRLPLERVPTAPRDLVTRAVDDFMPLMRDAEVALRDEVEPELPLVFVDVDRMLQVFGNLLTNALRHSSPGAEVRVSARRVGESVRFAVSNGGHGLNAQQAARVFEPFWRAEEARERDSGGSGLGLAITRQLVQLHGGRTWVESRSGETTFYFEIPAADGLNRRGAKGARSHRG